MLELAIFTATAAIILLIAAATNDIMSEVCFHGFFSFLFQFALCKNSILISRIVSGCTVFRQKLNC